MLLASKSTSCDAQMPGESGRIRGNDININRQRLNKSMSESHIDTSRVRHKYDSGLMNNASLADQAEQNEQDADAKNSCTLMWTHVDETTCNFRFVLLVLFVLIVAFVFLCWKCVRRIPCENSIIHLSIKTSSQRSFCSDFFRCCVLYILGMDRRWTGKSERCILWQV